MRKLVVIFMISLMSMSWSVFSNAQPNCDKEASATVISLQGNVVFDPNANGSWHSVQLNETLCQGTKIWVKPDSRISLALPGNDVLRLKENTVLTLKVINLNQTSLLNIVKGFIHFISRKPKEVKIESGIANAAPLGTEFAFSVDDSKAALWVYEGGVKFYNQHGSVKLSSGQAAEAYLGKAPQLRIDIKPLDAINWALYYPPLLPTKDGLKAADPSISAAINDYRKGRIDLALQGLAAMPAEQQTPHFHKVRGALRLILGQVKLAQQDIKAVQAGNAKDAEALALQSVIALTQNHKDQAFELANKAISSNPQSATAYTALSYAEQGRFNLEKAQSAADKAAELAPQDAMALARKAELQLSQGLISDSEKTVQQAISLDGNLERTQTIKGFTYLMNMDTDEAMQAFDKAITLDSTSPLARLGIGLAKVRDGELEEGRKELEIAANLDPNNSLIRSYLGKAYYEEKRSDRAEEQFKLAKERDPKDPTPYFYDAIQKQTTNRPVKALNDMQKAIDLNDNRQIYRSNLLLDEDKAIRSASLGRIYKELGFDDVARWQATNSLNIDPSNYSAHRLLADSYLYRPRQELARASEVLQAQLLQPLNYYPIQPQLAYTDLNIPKSAGFADTAFNEYTQLFEGDRHRFTATGFYGSNNTAADEAVISGINEKFAYSLGQMHYQTDGFRPNADLKHDLYNVFAQYQFAPQFSIQGEYRHRETEHGDIRMRGIDTFFENQYNRNLEQDTYRIGTNFQASKQSNLLFSFIYSERAEKLATQLQDENTHFPFDAKSLTKNNSLQFESQYLYRGVNHNVTMGGGSIHSDVNDFFQLSNPSLNIFVPPSTSNFQVDHSFGYIYSNIDIFDTATATFGIAYDAFHDEFPGGRLNISQMSPKLGLQWRLSDEISFRVAGFQTVKSPIVVKQSLQSMQVAGFNQFFDDFNGTRATQYGAGVDVKPLSTNTLFLGAEAIKRDLEVPKASFDPNDAAQTIKWNEEFYRLFVNWTPLNSLILNMELRFENFRGSELAPEKYETAYLPLNIRFYDDSGFFADLTGQYVHQSVAASHPLLLNYNFDSNFFLVDAAIGYRFPQRYGIFSLEAKNLLDKNFKYADRSFQMNEFRASDLIPERLLYARITFNF